MWTYGHPYTSLTESSSSPEPSPLHHKGNMMKDVDASLVASWLKEIDSKAPLFASPVTPPPPPPLPPLSWEEDKKLMQEIFVFPVPTRSMKSYPLQQQYEYQLEWAMKVFKQMVQAEVTKLDSKRHWARELFLRLNSQEFEEYENAYMDVHLKSVYGNWENAVAVSGGLYPCSEEKLLDLLRDSDELSVITRKYLKLLKYVHHQFTEEPFYHYVSKVLKRVESEKKYEKWFKAEQKKLREEEENEKENNPVLIHFGFLKKPKRSATHTLLA